MWLSIKLPAWWIGCWVKATAIHKNITTKRPRNLHFSNMWMFLSIVMCFVYARSTLSASRNIIKICKLQNVYSCWWDFYYLLEFSLLIKTNDVLMVYCQPWDDDFPACNPILRVLKLKIYRNFPGSGFLPIVPPAALAYVSAPWWCTDAAGLLNAALTLITI